MMPNRRPGGSWAGRGACPPLPVSSSPRPDQSLEVCLENPTDSRWVNPPESPLFKGRLAKEFQQVPPFEKGGLGGIEVFGAGAITAKTFTIPDNLRYGFFLLPASAAASLSWRYGTIAASGR